MEAGLWSLASLSSFGQGWRGFARVVDRGGGDWLAQMRLLGSYEWLPVSIWDAQIWWGGAAFPGSDGRQLAGIVDWPPV